MGGIEFVEANGKNRTGSVNPWCDGILNGLNFWDRIHFLHENFPAILPA
jgi:hypothetical protein